MDLTFQSFRGSVATRHGPSGPAQDGVGTRVQVPPFMRPPLRIFIKRTTFLLLLIGAACAELCAQSKPVQESAAKPIRLLTVGNSFSHNAVHLLPELAKSAGKSLVLRELII